MLRATPLVQRLAGPRCPCRIAPRGGPPSARGALAAARAYAAGPPYNDAGGGYGGQQQEEGPLVYDAQWDPASRNAVWLTGNLSNVEERKLPSGASLLNFSLAVSAGREKTDWFNVTAYPPLADQARDRVGRGSRVVVQGYLRQEKWVDKASGANRSAVKVVARSIGVLARRDGYEQQQQDPDQYQIAGTEGAGGQGYPQEQQQHQQPEQRGPAGGGGGGGAPLPEAPATDVEALWLSVVREPQKWWDNRNSKRNPRGPDFKQRDGEAALWLSNRDVPAWVEPNLPPPPPPRS